MCTHWERSWRHTQRCRTWAETNMDSYAFKGLEGRGKITGSLIFYSIKLIVVVQDLFWPYDAYRKKSGFIRFCFSLQFGGGAPRGKSPPPPPPPPPQTLITQRGWARESSCKDQFVCTGNCVMLITTLIWAELAFWWTCGADSCTLSTSERAAHRGNGSAVN